MSDSGPSWRLATFNIQYAARDRWLRKRDALGRHLQKISADVVCLQEVSTDGVSWLRDTLGPQGCVAAGREDGVHRGEHTPILWFSRDWVARDHGTFWFSETPERPSRAWGAAHPRICTWVLFARPQLPDLIICNLHLDHFSRRARSESLPILQTHLDAFDPEVRVVVAGDFNHRLRTTTPLPLLAGKRPLRDAGRDLADGVPTWRGWGPWGWGRARIDYVLTDSRLKVQACRVGVFERVERYVSDHFPVIVELSG